MSAGVVHGGQMGAIARRFGVEEEGLLDFSANLNPDGPPGAVWAELRRCVDAGVGVTAYPDLEEMELRRAVAEHAGVEAGQVVVGNGFGVLLEAALRAFAVRQCLLPVPCFGEYRRVLEGCGVVVTAMGSEAGRGFGYDLEAMGRRVVETGCDAVLLGNPQNPSGALTGGTALRAWIEEVAGRGVQVLLDEAFIDYVPEERLAGWAVGCAGVTVFRSLTKFYAMPGLRVSYAVAAEQRARAVQERVAAWAISTLAARAAVVAVGEREYAVEAIRRNLERREGLVETLGRVAGVEVVPGRANFLLLRVGDGMDAEVVWQRMIREHGVVLRLGASFEGLGEGYLRTAVRTGAENGRMVRGLAAVLGES